MRWRGVHHVEFSVLDYDHSIQFYDRMFGWLGYQSFWTLDIGYRSTYYMARFPVPHSYIGIQPAAQGGKLHPEDQASGIHHIALWARSRKEVDQFYRTFLLKENVTVTDSPTAYPIYYSCGQPAGPVPALSFPNPGNSGNTSDHIFTHNSV